MEHKKLSSYEKNERDNISDHVQAEASLLGMDDYYGPIGWTNTPNKDFGLCCTCKRFQFARTAFTTIIAQCGEFDLVLNPERTVKECTNYEKTGSLTLSQMLDMAVLLEVNKKFMGFETEK